MESHRVESWLNNSIALFGPLLVFVVVGCIKRSLLRIHHSAIGLFTSRCASWPIVLYVEKDVDTNKRFGTTGNRNIQA